MRLVTLPKLPTQEEMTPEQQAAYEERVVRFGDLASCGVAVDDEKRLVQVLIDNALPDDDAVLIQTNVEKAAKAIAVAVAGNVMEIGNDVKFFDGK